MRVRTKHQLTGYINMTNSFDISIPMKDHPMIVTIQPRKDENNIQVYDVYYSDAICGFFFCNEHNVWIYETHEEPSLLFNEDQIKHLGKEIGQHH
jgi:hypothetical protein